MTSKTKELVYDRHLFIVWPKFWLQLSITIRYIWISDSNTHTHCVMVIIIIIIISDRDFVINLIFFFFWLFITCYHPQHLFFHRVKKSSNFIPCCCYWKTSCLANKWWWWSDIKFYPIKEINACCVYVCLAQLVLRNFREFFSLKIYSLVVVFFHYHYFSIWSIDWLGLIFFFFCSVLVDVWS